MSPLPAHTLWGLAALLLCAGVLLLRKPFVWLLRLFLRSSAGLAGLALFSRIGPFLGVSLGVNPINAVVLGLLGLPGFGLLLMLQWALR